MARNPGKTVNRSGALGAVTLTGSAGDDHLEGGAFGDQISGAGGNDLLEGNGGDDLLLGQKGGEVLKGGDGDDTLRGGRGDDDLRGGDGDDLLEGDEGQDTLSGGRGADVASGGSGNDQISGNDGDDNLSGDDGADVISGGSGDDTATGGRGDDRIEGGSGDDTLEGGAGDDFLEGGAGDDILSGGSGDDRLNGGRGNDVLNGGFGNDTLSGGAGRDWLFAGQGQDEVDGGQGRDTLHLAGEEADWSATADGDATLWTNAVTGATVRARSVEKVVFDQHAPRLKAASLEASEDAGATLDLAPYARDKDIDASEGSSGLRFAITGQPGQGSARLEGSQLSFDPGHDFQDLAEGETREVVIEITVTDGSGQSAANQVTVTVQGGNDAPTLQSAGLDLHEDGPAMAIDLSPLAFDADQPADTLHYAVTGHPSEGAASIHGHELSFDPGRDFQDLAEGETREVEIEVTVTDEHGATATNTVTVTVTGQNDRPHSESFNLHAREDGPTVRYDLTNSYGDRDSDDDGESLLYWVTNDPSEGQAWISKDGHTLKFSAKGDFQDLAEGETREVYFKVRAEDSHGARTVEKIKVKVTGVNDRPTAERINLEAMEDGRIVYFDLAKAFDDIDSDDDGSTLKYWVTNDPSEGQAWISKDGQTLKFDPGSDFQDLALGETRDVTFKVRAEDSHGARTVSKATVTVEGKNDAPTLAAGTLDAMEDGPGAELDLSLLGGDIDSDDDGTTLTYTVTEDPAEGSASISGTTLTFDPGADFQDLAQGETRDVTVQVTATDRHGATAVNDVTVTVTGKNDAPTLAATTLSTVEDGASPGIPLPALGDDIDSDDDGFSLTYQITDGPTEGVAQIVGGNLFNFLLNGEFQDLAQGEVREVKAEITATDRHGATAVNDITIQVTGRNDAPTLGAGAMNAMEDGPAVDFDLSTIGGDIDSDDDGTTLTYGITGGPSGGNATISGSTLTYNPGVGFQDLAQGETRDVTINLVATDRHGATATNDLIVTVTGKNDKPTLGVGAMNAMEDGPTVDFDLSTIGGDIDSDDDGTTLTYTITGNPSEGSASITGNTLTFDPGADFQDLNDGETRDVTIQITATDRHGATVVNDVTVTVTGENDAPKFIAFFKGVDTLAAAELWGLKDDGSVTRLPEIFPGSESGIPGSNSGFITEFDGALIFAAENEAVGYELFRLETDGTVSVVGDIFPGGTDSNPGRFGFTKFNGALYFSANDGTTGNQLWKLDAAGNLTRINVASSGSSDPGGLSGFVEFNGALYFSARDPANGFELRKLDTSDTVTLVDNIAPGNFNSLPGQNTGLVEFNGALYFAALNPTNGLELRKLDAAGNVTLVADIRPGNDGSAPGELVVFNNALYFSADDGTNGRELWKVDSSGTASLVANFRDPGSFDPGVTGFVEFNGALYFRGHSQTDGFELFKLDASDNITQVADIFTGPNSSSPGQSSGFQVFDGALYFAAFNAASGLELHKLDAAGNVTLVADILPGAGNSSPRKLQVVDGKLTFTAMDDSGQHFIFSFDGTTLTKHISGNTQGSDPGGIEGFFEFGGEVYFRANDGVNGTELFKYDSAGNVVLVADINSGAGDSFPGSGPGFFEFGGDLYFSAEDPTNGRELRKLDSLGNVTLVDNIAPGTGGSSPGFGSGFVEFDGALYFAATDPTNGFELRKLDSSGNVTLVDNLNFAGNSSSPVELTVFDNALYFVGSDSVSGRELRKLDTAGNVTLVEDIRSGPNSSNPSNLFEFDGALYFLAFEPTAGAELYKLDTAGNVTLVDDLYSGVFSSVPGASGGFIEFNNELYFSADNGTSGIELFKFDGTTISLVADVFSGAASSFVGQNGGFTIFDNELYFTANDGTTGDELHKVDASGTLSQVADINSGAGSSNAGDTNGFVEFNGDLYFDADDGVSGRELWKLDGTTKVVSRAFDIEAGAGSSNPDNLEVINGKLFFKATTFEAGTELYVFDGTTLETVDINEQDQGYNPSFVTPVVEEDFIF